MELKNKIKTQCEVLKDNTIKAVRYKIEKDGSIVELSGFTVKPSNAFIQNTNTRKLFVMNAYENEEEQLAELEKTVLKKIENGEIILKKRIDKFAKLEIEISSIKQGISDLQKILSNFEKRLRMLEILNSPSLVERDVYPIKPSKKGIDNFQNKILKELFMQKKELSVSELTKNTKLNPTQIHKALQRLNQREFISKRKVCVNKARYKQPPFSIIKIKLKNYDFIESYLINRRIIQ